MTVVRIELPNGTVIRTDQVLFRRLSRRPVFYRGRAHDPAHASDANSAEHSPCNRTCRAQLIARLNESDLASLEAMNRRLAGWVEGEYHQCPHRGLDNKAPLEKWAEVSEAVKYPDLQMDLDDLFLFEDQRRVRSDRTVSLHGRVFEVDATLIGQRVTLRCDPSRPDAFVPVAHQGKFIEQARQVDLYANCFVKRHRRTGALDVDRKPEMPVTKLSMRSPGRQ